MKKILLIFASIFALTGTTVWAADSFDVESMAIVDSEDYDITAEAVDLNEDAEVAQVSDFDIAGVMLGMGFDDVYNLFFRGGGLYAPRTQNSIIYTILPDWKYNLDYECRQQGIIIPSELERCINTLAKDRGLMYASEVHLVRANTGETLAVYFTSNATDNRVWRVLYNNDVNELEGTAEKFVRQRENKILAFWQNVLDKYGAPNSGTDKWISTNNAYDPMMIAYYGALELVDKGRNASDLSQNKIRARKNFKSKSYAF